MRFFQQYPHVTAAMSEQRHGPMGSSTNHGPEGEYAENRRRFLAGVGIPDGALVMAGLVHGTAVRTVISRPETGRVPNCDALITRAPGIALAMTSADCLPVFCCELRSGMVGIIHAGWRGLLDGIIGRMISELEDHGAVAARTLVAVGPAIQRCCYFVRDDARGIEHFRRAGYDREPFAAEAPDAEGRYAVDLPAIARHQLTAAGGVPPGNVWVSPDCTRCDQHRQYYSRRGGDPEGRNMLSVIQFLRRGTRDSDAMYL